MLHRRSKSNVIDTVRLDAFFEALDHLDQVGLLRMRAAWAAVDHHDHEDAWTAVRTAGALNGFGGDIDKVKNRAMAWSTRGNNAIPYLQDNNPSWAQTKLEAAEAIVDVALGVAFGKLLDEKVREILLAPWDGTL
jgi:hypothetical protein